PHLIPTTDAKRRETLRALLNPSHQLGRAVANSLKLAHVKRYKDIAVLLIKYGRSDVVKEAGWEDVPNPQTLETPAKAEELAADLEAMGPTLLKLGQLLSRRSDLLLSTYIEALSRLQSDVAPFPFPVVVRLCTDD